MSQIFGGSKQNSTGTSSSSNRAFDQLSAAFGPTFGYAQTGGDALIKLLSGDASGFNAYKNATGFDQAAEAGSRGITGNAAAGGLLRSGSTSKGLASFYNGLQNQYAGNYMDRLLGLAGLGIQGGNVVSGAGNVSQSQSQSKGSSKPGLGGFLGAIGAGIAGG